MNFSQKLLQWFSIHGRKNLPWQKKKTLYRVWISEIMLQQTQVQTVIPYFERFMEHFPTLPSLAKASLDEVLTFWAGLGYYARARNCHKTAVIIYKQHKGIFPKDYETLIQMPGIGPSTAGAILALTLKQPHPILDGNVKRILCRYFAIEGSPTLPLIEKKLWTISKKLTPEKRVDEYTQAIMDLGATLCTRTEPKCHQCPLAKNCVARKTQKQDLYPNRNLKLTKPKPRKSAQFLIIMDVDKQNILLKKQPNSGIWGGLWTLPEIALEENIQDFLNQYNLSTHLEKKLSPIQHQFTHFHLQLHPIFCKVRRNVHNKNLKLPKNYGWHEIQNLTKALPAPIKKILELEEICEK